MTAAHTNDELQRLDEAFSAELAALSNDIYLNSALFARVDAVWQQRHSLGLDDESLRLVDVIHQRFVLAGAQLAEEDKARLKVLNTESATLMSQFNQRLLAASKAGGLAVDDAHCPAGLSPEEMTVAAEAAREKGWRSAGSFRSLIRRNSLRLLRCAIARPAKIYSQRHGLGRKKEMPTIPALSFSVW